MCLLKSNKGGMQIVGQNILFDVPGEDEREVVSTSGIIYTEKPSDGNFLSLKVAHVGPDVRVAKKGQRVFMNAQWTTKVVIEGTEYLFSDNPERIIAIL